MRPFHFLAVATLVGAAVAHQAYVECDGTTTSSKSDHAIFVGTPTIMGSPVVDGTVGNAAKLVFTPWELIQITPAMAGVAVIASHGTLHAEDSGYSMSRPGGAARGRVAQGRRLELGGAATRERHLHIHSFIYFICKAGGSPTPHMGCV